MRKIVYMEWVKLKPRAKFEIGGSGVTPVTIGELPEAREAVEINDFNLYGYRPLLDQIARRYEVKREQVVTAPGTSMANYLAYAALVRAGDEVLIEKPAYEPLLSIARLLDARITRFARPFRRGFEIDLDDLAAKLTRKTKLVVLTNMHNPSGVLSSHEVLREAGRLAARVGAHVLVDEVYLDFLFEKRPRSAVHLGDNFLITASLTKAYGFDGLRCGWVLAPPKLAEAIWRLQDFYGVNGAVPSEKISTVAFEHLERFEERTRRAVTANRRVVDAFMTAHAKKLKWVAPDGGPVCFPQLLNGEKGWDLAERLYRDYATRVIPGNFFESPKHIRIGFGGKTAALKSGLERLAQALTEPRPEGSGSR
jgi:aspartate/methionine/tyrosine aminotransferase